MIAAPRSSRSATADSWPFHTAQWSGVEPSASRAPIRAGSTASSAWSAATSPCLAARMMSLAALLPASPAPFMAGPPLGVLSGAAVQATERLFERPRAPAMVQRHAALDVPAAGHDLVVG